MPLAKRVEGERMAENSKENTQKGKYDAKTVVLAVVVVVVLAGAAYYAGLFNPSPVAPPGQQAPNLNAPDVQLFLSSMSNQAAITQEYTNYTDVSDGAAISYEIAANQTNGWVHEIGGYGSLEGYFFGADNASYVICLNYENQTKCAKTGTDPVLLDTASRLISRLPDSRTALANLQFSQKLIAAGAMKFPGVVENDSVNGFNAQKISYTLDYSNLTVQTLESLGIPPNDPGIYSITGWTVSNWVDTVTGQIVRSTNAYTQSGVQHSFSRDVAAIQTSGVAPPPVPTDLVSTSEFSTFYQNSENEYNQMGDCFTNNESDTPSCLKGVASENGDFRVCRLITDETQRGQCMLVVAQTTADAGPCALAGSLADDCYIAVVSQTGNGGLCNDLQNSSLLQTCYKAKIAGDQAVAEKKAEMEQVIAGENCAIDSDCKVAGNENQYCIPKNNTKPIGNETSPEFACLQRVPCGCVSGYCKFKENESANYSNCVDNFENQQLQEYIQALTPKNATANQSINTSSANSTG